MAIQAECLDYLNPGSEVKIITSTDGEFTGEVVACDGNQRIVLLKSHRPDQPPEVDDLHLINMDQVKNVEVLREVLVEDTVDSETFHVDVADLQAKQSRLLQAAESAKQTGRPQGVPSTTTE
ncbi:hypothetical protein BV898_05674 [Hypsibius exemplaris]|uniref:LSM12 LSM domain-containing protein n=1 Tax=Hypsibius exemplaris TaxID=2072580 RepID=A0A1W0WYW1_HYPEX|nr:hypothetical protein BV898_05674 [Hypsibius exemplaris]